MSVTVTWGHADQYWDVSFEDGKRISVHVDEVTGLLSVNHGFAEGTPQRKAEADLFEDHQNDIEGQLLAAVLDKDEPGYAAFKARHLSVPGIALY